MTLVCIQGYICELCKTAVIGTELLVSHLSSSEHTKRMAEWLDQTGELYSNYGGVSLSTVVMPPAVSPGEVSCLDCEQDAIPAPLMCFLL